MTYTVRLDQNKGNRLASKKDSSSFTVPGGSAADLLGCNNETHLKGSSSFTFNHLLDCVPQGIALVNSVSGIVAKQGSGTRTLYSYDGTLSGISVDVSLATLLTYAFVGLTGSTITPSEAFVAANIKDALGITTDVVIEILSGTILVKTPGANSRLIAQLSAPSISPVEDNCGVVIGYNASASISLSGFDEDTCVPITVWQMSAKASFASALYSDAATAIGNIVTQQQPILEIVTPTTSDVFAAMYPKFVEKLNVDYVLGAA